MVAIIFMLTMSTLNVYIEIWDHVYAILHVTQSGVNLDFTHTFSILFLHLSLIHFIKSNFYVQLFRSRISRLISMLESYWIGWLIGDTARRIGTQTFWPLGKKLTMRYKICLLMMALPHYCPVPVSNINCYSSIWFLAHNCRFSSHCFASFYYRYKLLLLRENCGNLEGNGSGYEKFIWTLRLAKDERLAGDFTTVWKRQCLPWWSLANAHEKCQLRGSQYQKANTKVGTIINCKLIYIMLS